jgi:hypothetical protein
VRNELWPTPGAADSHQVTSHKGGNPSLTGAVLWPTPTATDANASGSAHLSTKSGRHSGTTLTDAAVKNWPTPTATDANANARGANAQGAMPLNEAVLSTSPQSPPTEASPALFWATPAARDDHGPTGRGYATKGKAQLPNQVARDDGPALADQLKPVLNPRWVEALMGFPLGWTEPSPIDGPRGAAKPRTLGSHRGRSRAEIPTGAPDCAPSATPSRRYKQSGSG